MFRKDYVWFLFLVSSKWNWSLHLFLGRPMCLCPFGLYCSACLDILFVSILCMCCSHFSCYCFISFTIFSAPVFSLIHWFFSLSSFVIPRRCLKNFICAASKRFPSLFFSTQASLPNFNAALAVMALKLTYTNVAVDRSVEQPTTNFTYVIQSTNVYV